MELREMMKMHTFAVLGDTLNEEKYAYKIKNELIKKGYEVYPVYKEIKSINDINGEIDIIDMCINPIKGLQILKECKKGYKGVIIQPGAESDEIKDYLTKIEVPYVCACVLVALKLYVE